MKSPFCIGKKVKTGILNNPSPGEIEIKISRMYFQAQTYLFQRGYESCWE